MSDRAAFAERIRLQLSARYPGVRVDTEPDRFALRVTAAGMDISLPLAPLQNACRRQPERTAALIAEYVASTEHQLTPRGGAKLAPSRLLWCVRGDRYLEGIARADELLTDVTGGGMTAFVAEELPGSIMRGVPRPEWVDAGLGDPDVRDIADENTAQRFAKLVERIRGTDRIPADGWRMAGDPLFQGSILKAGSVLAAFADRAGGDVLLGVPDRGVALAIPATQPAAERFHARVLREWREAMNPSSREVLVTDGTSLRAVPRRRGRTSAFILPWLGE